MKRFALSFLFFAFLSPLPAQQSGGPIRRWTIAPELTNITRPFPALVPHAELKRPKIALVLSGGGARGIASIGVLEAFERNNIPIDFIVGTSIGSIVGGLYCAGYSVDDLRNVADSTNWGEILSLTDETRRKDLFYDQKLENDKNLIVLRFDGFEPVLPEAFSTGQRLTMYLNILALQGIYHPSPSFDDLRIPFRAVATDLVSGKRVTLDRGDLSQALRASTTVPLLFSTVKRDTVQLLDGGLVSNIPADVAREWGADIVIVVDVTSPLRTASDLNAPWEYADQIIGIAMQLANKEQLKNADFVIRPLLGEHLSTDFANLDTLIRQGREASEVVLPLIRANIDRRLLQPKSDDSSSVVLTNPVVEIDPSIGQHPLLDDLRAMATSSLTIGTARQRLTRLYATGDFRRAEIQVEEYADRTLLRLSAERNPFLNDVTFEGNELIPTDTLHAAVASLLGRRIRFGDSREAMENILELYRKKGYSLARIRSASLNEVTGIAEIRIDEGIVSRRTIVGTKKTKDYVLWRELPWKQGDVFDIHRISEGLSNLYGTNLFEQLTLSVEQEGNQQERQIVVIDARERYTDLMRLGMTIDNERNVQPSVDLRDENFLGIASELGIHFFGGLRNRYYAADFKANRIFNSYLTFDLKGYYGLRDINVFKDGSIPNPSRWTRVRSGEYREVREGVSLSIGMQLERLGLVTIDGRSEYQRVWSIFNVPVLPQAFHVSSVKIGTRVDSRDHFPYPRDGDVMEFSYESGLVTSADRLGFTKMFFNYTSYRTFFNRQTISPRIRIGFGDDPVPITEMFSLGGQDSFFGYREDNARGRQLFALGLEYRYFLPVRILFDTYVKLRYDLGHIWDKPEQIRLKDMRHGLGLAIGLDTPIGPAEVSVGRAFFIRKDLFNDPLSYGPVVAYFTVGYAF